jgi:hypothetical protein
MLERSEGFQVREQYLMQRLRTPAGASWVLFQTESFEPAALAEHLFEREELEPWSPVPGDEEPGVRHIYELRGTRDEESETS